LLVSFRLYFVIAGDSSCISTMYYLLLWIYVVLIVKKKVDCPAVLEVRVRSIHWRVTQLHFGLPSSPAAALPES
jgi:hypothetical protein